MTSRRFVKMQGAGNDFLIVQPEFFGLSNQRSNLNTFSQEEKEIIVPQVVDLCRHKFSVGADGILVVSEVEGRYKMSVFNSDGYMGANCGNGLRCVALYLHKTRKLGYSFKIATDSGDKQAELTQREDKEWMVQINLGSPAPITEVLYDLPNHPISTRYLKDSRIYLCSIGNKHYVIFLGLEDYQRIAEEKAYAAIAAELVGMESVNINFCHVESRKDLRIVTCEFGAGVTLACGTGSTTSAYVGFATGLLEKEVNVHTKGGLLVINSQKTELGYDLSLKGPAKWVYSGELPSQ